MGADPELVLLYDGLCGFCNGTVRFILARDRAGRMKFAPLQGEFAKAARARHPELAHVDSFVLVARGAGSEERVFTRSEATFAIARYLGWPWRLMVVLRVAPSFLRDWGYDRFAQARYRVFGRYDSCPVPDPAVSKRFLT